VRARADEVERGRRLPADLAGALGATGLFRLCVARELGGIEATPRELVEIIEALAEADGSVGWCGMIGASGALLSGYLPDAGAREVFGDPGAITGGVFAPRGRAEAVAGGFRVSGRWAFASGCQHSGWLSLGCAVADKQDVLTVLVPAAELRVLDTWTVAGLCGTGSHDVELEGCVVPAERAVSLVRSRPRRGGPLFGFPAFGLLALGVAAVAMGIARRAVDELVTLAGAKTPTMGRRTLASRASVQADVARAEALLRSGRAFVADRIDAAWARASGGGEVTVDDRAWLRLAATHATQSAAQAVDLMYAAGGGTAIYRDSALQRCFRDVHTVTQHMMVAGPTLELAGRVRLGLEPDAML